MKYKSIGILVLSIIAFLTLAACQTGMPENALQLNPQSMKHRHMQTRVFDTKDESTILSASAAVLQDMGYAIKESETKLGVIVGSKRRETSNQGEKSFVHTMMVLNALAGQYDRNMYNGVDDKQKIRVALVSSKVANQEKIKVRVTFQRRVWDMRGNLHKLETLDNPELYTGFFSKLSKAIFLEAHKI